MLKAIRVSAMLLVLVSSAHAGIILTPPAPQPPPTNTPQDSTTASERDASAGDALMQAMLDLLAVLPSLP